MSRLIKKELYEITLNNFIPPYLDYEYFSDCDQLPFRCNSTDFDMINAWWLIEASTLAYAEPDFATEIFKNKAGFQEIKFISDKTTQCFVASNDKFAIIAFRGSEGWTLEKDSDLNRVIADWVANFDFLPERWEQGGNVHRGFKIALDEVWESLDAYLSDLQKANRKLWFTGHSLGAALALLAAQRYGDVQGVYTYGSPRVGDEEFKQSCHVNAYRFVNNSDIVTKVPPAGMYYHVGELKFIAGDGIIRDAINRRERWSDDFQDKIKNILNAIGQKKKSLTELLLEPIIDHVPILYAIHIWNNL